MGAVPPAKCAGGHGLPVAPGAGVGPAAAAHAGRAGRLCVLRRLRRGGAAAAVLPAGLGGGAGAGRRDGGSGIVVRRRQLGIDPRHHRRYTDDRRRVPGAGPAENGGLSADGLGVGGPREAEDVAAAAGGADAPCPAVQRGAGHRVLPAAGQRAGGGILHQPRQGGGGRGKGCGAGELDRLPEAG